VIKNFRTISLFSGLLLPLLLVLEQPPLLLLQPLLLLLQPSDSIGFVSNTSVADPGSGAFLTPGSAGSGIGNKSGSWD
jgi:hypothetical protein